MNGVETQEMDTDERQCYKTRNMTVVTQRRCGLAFESGAAVIVKERQERERGSRNRWLRGGTGGPGLLGARRESGVWVGAVNKLRARAALVLALGAGAPCWAGPAWWTSTRVHRI